MWTKRTTDAATRIGERAIELIRGHDWGRDLDARDRHFIARACALAADEIAGPRLEEIAPPDRAPEGRRP